MRHGFRAVVAGGLGFAVSLIAACGSSSSSGLLSADTATSLTNQLQQASTDIQQGNCAAAHDELAKLSQDIQNLPSSVNSTLRSNLNEGLTRAQELAATQCKSPTSTTPTTTTATTTTPTTTTETTTQPTTTQTTTTQTTPPTTTTPATTPVNPGTTSIGPGSGGVAPGTNNGNGKGNGKGNGH